MILHCVTWELFDIVPLNCPTLRQFCRHFCEKLRLLNIDSNVLHKTQDITHRMKNTRRRGLMLRRIRFELLRYCIAGEYFNARILGFINFHFRYRRFKWTCVAHWQVAMKSSKVDVNWSIHNNFENIITSLVDYNETSFTKETSADQQTYN